MRFERSEAISLFTVADSPGLPAHLSQSQLPTSRDHVWEVKIAGDCRTNKKSCEHMGMIEKHLFIYICEDKNPFSPSCLF